MEVPVIRQFHAHLGSEKHQMLELNKRLEVYLSRVKFLEEENELLKEEIQNLQRSGNPQAWKGELEGQLRVARGEVEAAWMERDRVELEMANLGEDLQALGLQRQKEAATQAEARKGLAESKKELEQERMAQIWLREKVSQLEKELRLQLEIHQEEVSLLQARLSHARPVFAAPPHTEALDLQDLSQQYSERATRAWQEAAAGYQDQVKRLEDSLCQARDHMAQVAQEKREGCLMVQRLAKELDGARNKKKLLEETVSQQRNRDLNELELLQAHLEALEGDKAKMRDQLSDIMDDRHNLLQLKMSLGLEVATYRALLDNESLRVNKPSISNPWGSFTVDGGSSHRSFKQRLQTTNNGSHITTPVSIKLGERTQATAVAMTMTPVQISQDASKHKPKSAGFTEGQGGWSVESSRRAAWSTPYPKEVLKGKGLIEPFRKKEVQEEVSHVAALLNTRSLELDPAGTPMENCNIDELVTGGSDVSREEMGEKEEHSLTAGPEKHTSLNATEPSAEQHSAACHSNVFSPDMPSQFHPEIQAPASPKVTLNPSEAHESPKDSEDMGAKVSMGRDIESAHAPLFAWGEEEEVQGEIEWAVAKASEFELASGSDIKDRDCGFNSTIDDSNLSGFDQYEQAAAKCDSIMSLEATILSEDGVLSHEGKTKEALSNENENRIKEKCNGDDSPDRFEPEEQVEDELVPEEDRMDAWDRDNMCKTKADSTDKSEELGHVNEYEQRETRKEMDEVIECTTMEENERDLDTENTVVSADEDPAPDSQIDGNPGDVQQQRTSSDAEQLEFSEEDGDDSQNACHSWRTEGGDLESNGSYSLENTLADTRPLIRYKSDEADMNTQASQLGDSDLSDDEGNGDKGGGAGCWGEDKRRVITSKSIEFMEDLEEEPERYTVKEEAIGEEGEEMDAAGSPTGEEMIFMNDEDDESEREVEEGMAPLQDESTLVEGPTEPIRDTMENISDEENGGHRYVVQERESLSISSPTGEEIILMNDEAGESERVVEEGMAPLQDETTLVEGPTKPITDTMENISEEENGGHRYVVQERESLSLSSPTGEEITLINDEAGENERVMEEDMTALQDETTHVAGPTEPMTNISEEENGGHRYVVQERESLSLSSQTGEEITLINDEAGENERVMEEDMTALQDETTLVAGPTEPMTNISEEENGGHRYVVQERDSLSLYSNDDLKGETVDNEAALGLQTEHCGNDREETKTLQPPDSVNSSGYLRSQSQSDAEEEVIRSHTEALAATSSSPTNVLQDLYKQSPFSETVEISPIQNMDPDEGTGQGEHNEDTEVLTDRREEGQNLSMLTNVDFTDKIHSELSSTMGSLVNTANSDFDEYSSEDDSPNASQFLQPIKQEEVAVDQEDSVGRISTSHLSEGIGESAGHSLEFADPGPENVTEDVTDHRIESDVFLQDQGDVVESPSAKLWGHESFVQSVENIAECSQMLFHNEDKIGTDCVAEEKLRAASQPSGGSNIVSDEEDGSFKFKENEALPQTNGKCHDLDNVLSTTLHERTWSSSKKNEVAHNPRGSLAFGVSWGDTENLLEASEHTEGNMEMSQAPSLQVNQLLGGKMEEHGSHSDDSLEEGDSWSSGEE